MDQHRNAKKPWRAQVGATMVSYALAVGLIGVVALSAVTRVGDSVTDLFDDVASDIDGTGPTRPTPALPTPEVSPTPPCGANPQVGQLCPDDTFYIGIHPPSGDPLFAAACDIGRSFNRGSGECSGPWDLMTWNDGSTLYRNSAIAETGSEAAAGGDYDGRAHTATLVSDDSSQAGGLQPHVAARGCDGYSAHGYADWYLPAEGELDLMWAATHPDASTGDDQGAGWLATALREDATAFGLTFDTQIFSRNTCDYTDSDGDQGASCALWSSTESFDGEAWSRVFSEASREENTKDDAFAIRCVRR